MIGLIAMFLLGVWVGWWAKDFQVFAEAYEQGYYDWEDDEEDPDEEV